MMYTPLSVKVLFSCATSEFLTSLSLPKGSQRNTTMAVAYNYLTDTLRSTIVLCYDNKKGADIRSQLTKLLWERFSEKPYPKSYTILMEVCHIRYYYHKVFPETVDKQVHEFKKWRDYVVKLSLCLISLSNLPDSDKIMLYQELNTPLIPKKDSGVRKATPAELAREEAERQAELQRIEGEKALAKKEREDKKKAIREEANRIKKEEKEKQKKKEAQLAKRRATAKKKREQEKKLKEAEKKKAEKEKQKLAKEATKRLEKEEKKRLKPEKEQAKPEVKDIGKITVIKKPKPKKIVDVGKVEQPPLKRGRPKKVEPQPPAPAKNTTPKKKMVLTVPDDAVVRAIQRILE